MEANAQARNTNLLQGAVLIDLSRVRYTLKYLYISRLQWRDLCHSNMGTTQKRFR